MLAFCCCFRLMEHMFRSLMVGSLWRVVLITQWVTRFKTYSVVSRATYLSSFRRSARSPQFSYFGCSRMLLLLSSDSWILTILPNFKKSHALSCSFPSLTLALNMSYYLINIESIKSPSGSLINVHIFIIENSTFDACVARRKLPIWHHRLEGGLTVESTSLRAGYIKMSCIRYTKYLYLKRVH